MAVILIGHGDYEEIELVADAIESKGGNPVVWDITRWPSGVPLKYEVGSDSTTVEDPVAFDSIEGLMIYRNYVFNPRQERFKERFEQYKTRQVLLQLQQWEAIFESLVARIKAEGATVLYPPNTEQWHTLKPAQVTKLKQADIPLPATTFTTDPSVVETFVETHGKIVAKPISMGARPEILTSESLTKEALEKLTSAPVQFQEYIPGEDIRVYVLDEEILGATRYVSDAWSFKNGSVTDIETVELSEEIETAVKKVSALSPLTFSAVDVRVSEDDFAVLESSPHPRFVAHEQEADQNISEAVSDYLLTHNGETHN